MNYYLCCCIVIVEQILVVVVHIEVIDMMCILLSTQSLCP